MLQTDTLRIDDFEIKHSQKLVEIKLYFDDIPGDSKTKSLSDDNFVKFIENYYELDEWEAMMNFDNEGLDKQKLIVADFVREELNVEKLKHEFKRAA